MRVPSRSTRIAVLGATVLLVVAAALVAPLDEDRRDRSTGGATAQSTSDQPAPDATGPAVLGPVDDGAATSTTSSIPRVPPAARRSPSAPDEAMVRFREPIRCPGAGAPTTGTFPGPDANGDRRWVVVSELDGRCDASSRPFRLRNADTRLTWRSDAEDLAIFLLDPADTASLAGFAQTTCAGACAGSMVILDKDVDALIRVQAGDAPWSVRVEQYLRTG